jgi:ketopantoate reductase
MRIAVFGTGGAGAYFGAQLARAGEDVIFLARGEHLQAIRTQGLRVETAEGEIVIRPTHASDKPAEVGVVDAVLVGETHFVKFGELNKRPSKRAERLRQAFERAGVKVEIPADIHAGVWENSCSSYRGEGSARWLARRLE